MTLNLQSQELQDSSLRPPLQPVIRLILKVAEAEASCIVATAL